MENTQDLPVVANAEINDEPVAIIEPVPKRRGRPPMTEEQRKANRVARNKTYYENTRQIILQKHAEDYKKKNPEGTRRIYRKANQSN